MPTSIGFRLTPDDERILREAVRPGESTTETLRRALRLLDHDRWLEQFRGRGSAEERGPQHRAPSLVIRGAVYRIDLGTAPGHEQAGKRLGLVVSPSDSPLSVAR